jgi:hypothetical protein
MCLIVDVNIAPNVLLTDHDPDFLHVHNRLFATKGPTAKLVYGGKLVEEYGHNEGIRRILRELDRAGRTRKIPDEDVENECVVVESMNECQSNDHHIIALARVGKVRLLCSRDHALIADFTNKKLLDSPRGKVYQYASHRELLTRFCKPESS